MAPTSVGNTVGGPRFCDVAGSGEGAAGNLERFQKVLGRFSEGFPPFWDFFGKDFFYTFLRKMISRTTGAWLQSGRPGGTRCRRRAQTALPILLRVGYLTVC